MAKGWRKANPASVKVQFCFRPEMVKLLDSIMQKTGAVSRAEVVRRAIIEYARKGLDNGFQDLPTTP